MVKHRFLPDTLLDEFLGVLRRFGSLHGPTRNGQGVSCFAPIVSADQLDLEYRRTQIPPKKYLLPFRETQLFFQDGRYRYPARPNERQVLFGLHPCDLAGIAYLDRVFLKAPVDPAYAASRAGTVLIGLSCEPDDYCFCSAPPKAGTCDLFLTRVEHGFQLAPQGGTGEELVRAARDLLVPLPVTAPPGACATLFSAPAVQEPQLAYGEHPLWQRFAESCVGCGACSACCPTCYCFDVREYPDCSGDTLRLREWDNCLFKSHGEVAGGNFRPSRLERLRYRFLHKYCGFSPLQGVASCVGCGRCKEFCPVDIDLRELIPAPAGAEVLP